MIALCILIVIPLFIVLFILYLAVYQHALRDIFEEPLGHLLLQNQLTRVIGFDPQQEVITQWLP